MGDIADLDKELQSVCKLVLSITCPTPPSQSRLEVKQSHVTISMTSSYASFAKRAKQVGQSGNILVPRPENGPLLEKKNADKRNVRMKLNQLYTCTGLLLHMETIDKMNRKRFHAPMQSPSDTRLVVDGNVTVVTTPAEVSTTWVW